MTGQKRPAPFARNTSESWPLVNTPVARGDSEHDEERQRHRDDPEREPHPQRHGRERGGGGRASASARARASLDDSLGDGRRRPRFRLGRAHRRASGTVRRSRRRCSGAALGPAVHSSARSRHDLRHLQRAAASRAGERSGVRDRRERVLRAAIGALQNGRHRAYSASAAFASLLTRTSVIERAGRVPAVDRRRRGLDSRRRGRGATPATTSAAAAFKHRDVAVRALLAREHRDDGVHVRRDVAARERLGRGARDAEVERVERDRAELRRRSSSCTVLVVVVVSSSSPSSPWNTIARSVPSARSVAEHPRGHRVVADADGLASHLGRVQQRTEEVERRRHAELLAGRARGNASPGGSAARGRTRCRLPRRSAPRRRDRARSRRRAPRARRPSRTSTTAARLPCFTTRGTRAGGDQRGHRRHVDGARAVAARSRTCRSRRPARRRASSSGASCAPARRARPRSRPSCATRR